MRAIWTQSTRPKVAGCVRGNNISRLRRETVSVYLPPPITFRDAFAILLPSVLTCAFVLDLSWKDLRRKEWDRKIAEVEQEIEVLQVREVQAWSKLQQRSVRLGASLQRRAYSTTARALAVEHHYNEDESAEAVAEFEPPAWIDDQTPTSLSTSLSLRSVEYQRMVAIQLALQMILHIHYSTSPKYAYVDTVFQLEPGSLPQDVNALVTRLKAVKQRLKEMSSGAPSRSSEEGDPSALRVVDGEIQTRVHAFQEGLIGLPDLVRDYATIVTKDGGVPSLAGYQSLLRCASQAEHRAVAYYIAWAMRTCGFPLDDKALYHLFLHYAKVKDTNMIDDLIKALSRKHGPHGSLPPFQVWKMDGSSVAVPRSADGRILRVLIYGALKNDQLDRAERWAMILRQKDQEWIGNHDVFKNFLVYYGDKKDWTRGRHWLDLCKRSLVDVAKRSTGELSRLVFRMLDFCVSCERREEYERILQSAAQAGCTPHDIVPNTPIRFADRALDIRKNWRQALQLHGHETSTVHDEVDVAKQLKDMLYDPSAAARRPEIYNYRLNLLTEPDPEWPTDTNTLPRKDQPLPISRGAKSYELLEGTTPGKPDLRAAKSINDGSPAPRDFGSQSGQGQDIDGRLWRELYQEQQKELIKLKLDVQESGNLITKLKNVSAMWSQLEKVLQHHSDELTRNTQSTAQRSDTGTLPNGRRMLTTNASTMRYTTYDIQLRMRRRRIVESLARNLKCTLSSPRVAARTIEPFASPTQASSEASDEFAAEPDDHAGPFRASYLIKLDTD